MVNCALRVASGRMALEDVTALLSGRDRQRAPKPAPPHALCLEVAIERDGASHQDGDATVASGRARSASDRAMARRTRMAA